MKTLLAFAFAFLFAVAPMAAHGQVYKCVDPTTKATTYSGSPCAKGDQKVISIVENAVGDDGAAQREDARRQTEQGSRPQAKAPGPTFTDQRDRLANECARNIRDSCSRLRALTAASGSGPEHADQKERLAARQRV